MKTKKKKKKVLDLSDFELKWEEELAYWAAYNDLKIKKINNGSHFSYTFMDRAGNQQLAIDSVRSVTFAPPKRRKKK